MMIHGKHSITRLYYYITPLFIALDYLGGINIRVAVLDSMPLYKNLYYGNLRTLGITGTHFDPDFA